MTEESKKLKKIMSKYLSHWEFDGDLKILRLS